MTADGVEDIFGGAHPKQRQQIIRPFEVHGAGNVNDDTLAMHARLAGESAGGIGIGNEGQRAAFLRFRWRQILGSRSNANMAGGTNSIAAARHLHLQIFRQKCGQKERPGPNKGGVAGGFQCHFFHADSLLSIPSKRNQIDIKDGSSVNDAYKSWKIWKVANAP